MEKKQGRPRKPLPENATSGMIRFRARGNYREDLERAGRIAGRSLSEECEFRLNRSIDRESYTAEIFGNEKLKPLIIAICSAARVGAMHSNSDEDKELQAMAAVIQTIQLLKEKPAELILSDSMKTGWGWLAAVAGVVAIKNGKEPPKIDLLSEIMDR